MLFFRLPIAIKVLMKLHKRWYQIIYLAISLTAFYYVGKKLTSFDRWDYVSKEFINDSWLLLAIVQIVLWSLNLGLESLRWQTLLSTFTKVRFFESVKMVLMGFATGSVTPLKSGEPGGKIVLLKKDERVSGVLVSVYGSYLNSAVLFLIAVVVFPVALTAGLIDTSFVINFSWYTYALLAIGSLLFSYFIVYCFFKQIKKQVINTKWALKPSVLCNFRLKRFLILFLYTLLRVAVYNLQLYIWFLFFNISGIGIDVLIISPLYFAGITLIPAMFLFDLGIRGSVGVFLFSTISDNTGALLSAIFFLWFLNVAIPVLWGSLLLIRKKSLYIR